MTELVQEKSKAAIQVEQERAAETQERVPVLQQVLDNPFLLLFLGVTIPTVFYILWGVMEVISIPIAN